jgi:matrixin
VKQDQKEAQGNLGRTSPPSAGSWWAYVQQSYEGPIEADWDPPAEGAILGETWDYYGKWCFVHAEAIRDYFDYWKVTRGFQQFDQAYGLQLTALHEIGHEFGLQHDNSVPNIMNEITFDANGIPVLAVPYFTPFQLRSVRCPDPNPTPDSDPTTPECRKLPSSLP